MPVGGDRARIEALPLKGQDSWRAESRNHVESNGLENKRRWLATCNIAIEFISALSATRTSSAIRHGNEADCSATIAVQASKANIRLHEGLWRS